jgi:hypothetical protein
VHRRGAAFAAGLGLLGPGCNDFLVSRQDPVAVDPVRVTESFVQAPSARVDLLWVIDDTPSMEAEHAALSNALGVFADALEEADLAWQIGVVTTDLGFDAGVLQGDPWILTPSDGADLAELLDIAGVGLEGHEPAGGLGAAALALSEPLRSAENRGFRRPDAALHIIIVSDGDDGSEEILGDSPASAFLDLVASESEQTGHAVTVSAIVGDRGIGCSGSGGTALPGDAYLAVAEATGGATGRICDTDLTGVAAAMGEVSVEWQVEFPLQATPKTGSIRVSVDGTAEPDGWSIDTDPAVLVFEVPPAPYSAIVVRYTVVDA